MVNKQSGNTGGATTAAQTVTITATDTDSNTTASDKAPFSGALLIISVIEFAHDRSVNGSLPGWTLRRPFLPEHPTQGHAA